MLESTKGRADTTSFNFIKITQSQKVGLWVVVGLTLLIRLGYVLVINKIELAWGDEFTYDQLANNILEHGCYCFIAGKPTVWRPPLYPAILALIYLIFGHNYLAVLLVQAVAGSLSTFLLVLIGIQISGSAWIGLITGLIFGLNPTLVFTTGLLYSETFYLLMLMLIVYLWLKLMTSPPNWVIIALGSGTLLGLANLMRPNLTLLPVWLIVWGLLVFKDRVQAVVSITLITLAMVAVMLPWGIRSFFVTGDFVIVSANSGLMLWQGNNSQVSGSGLDYKLVEPLPGLSEIEVDATYWQWGIEWIYTHPMGFVKLIPLKLYRFLSPLETSNQGQLVVQFAPLLLFVYSLYYLLGIIGLVKTTRQWQRWLIIYLLIFYPMLLAVVFYGGTRYGLVVQPFVSLLAAIALLPWLDRILVMKSKLHSIIKFFY